MVLRRLGSGLGSCTGSGLEASEEDEEESKKLRLRRRGSRAKVTVLRERFLEGMIM